VVAPGAFKRHSKGAVQLAVDLHAHSLSREPGNPASSQVLTSTTALIRTSPSWSLKTPGGSQEKWCAALRFRSVDQTNLSGLELNRKCRLESTAATVLDSGSLP
jgi:hypothetical protein